MSQLIKLSVSKTKTYLGCAKKYQFSYILKLPKKVEEYHTFGKFAHKVLEDFHIAYIKKSTDPFNKTMSVAFKNALAEYNGQLTPESLKELKQICNNYLKTVYDNPKILEGVISAEEEFNECIGTVTVPINGVMQEVNVFLNGMIDKVEMDDDNVLHVADYKTLKKETGKKYLKQDFTQLLTYAYIHYLKNNNLKQVRGSYILLRHDFEKITKTFGIEEILSVKEMYLKYAKHILTEKDFDANPTILCLYCDYVGSCSEGQKFLESINKGMPKVGEVSWME